MISYVKGLITFKTPSYVVVEAGGIGYHINISLYTYTRIEKLETVKLLTVLQVREDSHTLYGFSEEAERSLFSLLISVSGIGANTARVLLSGMTPEEARAAIIGEDVRAFNKVKGIGPKTAKRIILDLKDKVMKDAGDAALTLTPQNNTVRDEALQAMTALGFNKIAVQKALNKILKAQSGSITVENLIKAALKELS